MRGLWTVIRLELKLNRRGKAIWIIGLFMAILGINAASGIRAMPNAAWTNFGISEAFLITLILTLSTGDQINRDRERRLDGVILSTPISTAIYVWGKYLAALAMLLGLSSIYLIVAILVDQFDNWHTPPAVLAFVSPSMFPPLGPWPYVVIWGLLVIAPIIFGAALVFAGITITRGQRIIAYIGVLIIWLSSIFFENMPDLLDITTSSIDHRYTPPGSGEYSTIFSTNQFPLESFVLSRTGSTSYSVNRTQSQRTAPGSSVMQIGELARRSDLLM
jgi:hypothetical protein